MKICMGDKKADDTEPNGTEAHYGFPFIVQANRTLVCEVEGEMAEVAKMDIKMGRIMSYDKYMAMKKVAADEDEADAAETFEKYIEPEKPKPRPKPKGRPPAKPAARKAPDKEPEKDPEPDKKE